MSTKSTIKNEISLRYWLIGKGYYRALRAMEFAKGYHTGLRKDGVTPEFAHQVEIALYIRTISAFLTHPEETFCAVFLHDVREDFDVEDSVIRSMFGDMVADAVERLTKVFKGFKKDIEFYFSEIAKCPIASIVKGADRIHNVQSMIGVFSLTKQIEYVEEVKIHFLPMLKIARRLFPEQEAANENIKHMLRTQLQLVKAIHAAAA